MESAIEHAAHLLPQQRPITIFVHHNTLHAFEDRPFHSAVADAADLFGCHPYLPEEQYREEFARGRIRQQDLAAALLETLGDHADQLIGFMGTRYHLRLAMLEHPLPQGSDNELRWCIAETDALQTFRSEAAPPVRRRMIDETRRWIMRDLWTPGRNGTAAVHDLMRTVVGELESPSPEWWSDAAWEACTLHLLWQVCVQGVQQVPVTAAPLPIRHRDLLLPTGIDTDALVHPLLIRFCAAYLDQGFAHWRLPDRDAGFFAAFVRLYRRARPPAPWLRRLPPILHEIDETGLDPLESIGRSLHELGISEAEQEEFITHTLLALRGWAGMLRQMETNADWTPAPAAPGALRDFLAVRLLLECCALSHAATALGESGPLSRLRTRLRQQFPQRPRCSAMQRAFTVFQLAQVRGWTPHDLHRLSRSEWRRLVDEVDGFGGRERRRVYHIAYEHHFWNRSLDAIAAHVRRVRGADTAAHTSSAAPPRRAAYQVVCCIDEREESFRRHLEEIDPECQTLGVAGFFGVAMYYRGATEAHYRPLCPVVVTPQHYVCEEPAYSREHASRRQAETRRVLGRAAHRVHLASRTLLGGALTTLAGSVATVPLIARILFPRITARLRDLFGRLVTPELTQLRLERTEEPPGPDNGHIGYTLEEMAGIVGGTLRAIGLTRDVSDLVIVTGHGSNSLNNPHESAHDCGACGGGRGGPNARAFAQMANDPRIRSLLADEGLRIPERVCFVGAYHNTCDDSMTYYDLDRLPPGHRETFERARAALDAARRRNAHERCRRFESAPLALTTEAALRHVENRAADLSQTRPEYGHATNALCLVGRRDWSRGLFLDRRAFLTSYDPRQDDEHATLLTRILRAVIPVCAGISLEYYFSRIDSPGYGCGTKLPHNVTSLLGVMDGAASDLRPGLPWQMVEIHEPVRILFVIETTPEVLRKLVEREPDIRPLVEHDWVRIATLDPATAELHVYHDGRFERYQPASTTLPVAPSSWAWYRGQRDHLGFASIEPPLRSDAARNVATGEPPRIENPGSAAS